MDRRFWDIEQFVEACRQSECSPKEVVEQSLAVIEQWETRLNAFITIYADVGHTGGDGVLQGLPVALKDLVDVAGGKTTCGSRIQRNYVSSKDAVVWSKLKRAGAVLIGKTNMLEFAYGVAHPDYGQTNNPYDVKRTSGGSSGGSAAAVAVGAVFAGIGTDTGGSIRIPAAYCGVVGLKPTYGLVSTDGVFPLSWTLDHVGPITRTAKDAAFIMEVIHGANMNKSNTLSSSAGFLKAMNRPSNVRSVGYLPDELLRYTHPDMKRAYVSALQTLSGQGIRLVSLSAQAVRELQRAENVLMNILLPEAAQVHREWWHRKDEYAALTWHQISEGRKTVAIDYLQALEDRQHIRQEISRWLMEFDALVTPTVDFPAPLEDPAIGDVVMNEMRYTGPFNVSGHPAVTVPCGLSREGLPLGVQFVGQLHDDARLLRFAHEFETDHPAIVHPEIARQ